ncbi:hypothetical protein QQS21_006580 [Conoideocrella luteorostrata]|uniref:Uncharacterized protein n=1 Tax=Conoideocrella luteorostrata TaxID=1105319 RepID=A0AAJ0FXU7_9HYPO|nr:hypothetical protein QQS21_006580 [Conoideocrella luteorostrata]
MHRGILLCFCLAWLARASLPWGSAITTPVIKRSDSVSFDPLAVLAILWNPRASVSASRLYAQPYHKRFRWPHLMQIGAVTVPVSVLVGHLTRNYRSTHPALEMFMGNVDKLNVKSTIGKVINLFPTLPLSSNESSLSDSLAFRPSRHPGNDIRIISLLWSGKGSSLDGSGPETRASASIRGWFICTLVFRLTELGMGLIIACGLTFSVLLADMWGVFLFGSYMLHWVASTMVSVCQLIQSDTWKDLNIREDNNIVYAVFERPSGGWVVFKGTQETMERWARTSWLFVGTPWHRLVHWLWMVTGLLAALASVANMVNMNGYIQLGFLGMLVYGSVAELWLTVVDQIFQADSLSFLGPFSTHTVHSNDKKYKSVIQASLGLDAANRIGPLSWTSLGLLPKREPFPALERVVATLLGAAELDEARLEQALQEFDQSCKDLPQEDHDTRQGIRDEIERVCGERLDERRSKAHVAVGLPVPV